VDLKTTMVMTAIFAGIACFTAIAASPIGRADKEAATAAALRFHFGDYLNMDNLSGDDENLPDKVLCLDSDVPLNIGSVAQNLTDTIVKPVPGATCSSETIEGDFRMFIAITNYFGPDGDEAGHLVVKQASCGTTKSCVIDIDGRGSGMRYSVKRFGQTWNVVNARLRWIA